MKEISLNIFTPEERFKELVHNLFTSSEDVMIKKFSALFFLFLLAINGSVYVKAQGTAKDEAAVYAAVLDALFAKKMLFNKPVKSIVLENTTRFDDFEGETIFAPDLNLKPLSTELKPETIQNFTKQNAARAPITAPAKTILKVDLLDGKEAQATAEFGRWKKLYAAYPDSSGIVSLSKVGFDKTGTQALVYIANIYGEDAGKGTILFLQKTGQQWKIKEQVVNWAWAG
jgi:hypothetical protein